MLNWLRRDAGFQADLGLDLGSWQSRLCNAGGPITCQASAVLWDLSANDGLFAGDEAAQRVGRHPRHWSLIRPIRLGLLADFDAAEKLCRQLLASSKARKSQVLLAAPPLAGDIELQVLAEMVREAGASTVCLVPSSACLAFASGLPILESAGLAVVDLGHGLSQATVYSRGSAVLHLQEDCGGQELAQRLREHFRRRHWLAVGETELSRVMGTLHCVTQPSSQEDEWLEVRGQDLQSGLPRRLTVANWELNRLLELSLQPLQRMLSRMVEDLPPEILHQILQQGVFLAGGLSQLHGLSSYLEQHLALPVHVLPQAELAVCSGLQGFLQQSSLLQVLLASGAGAGRFA